jgi:hypothetical protein
VNYQEIITIEPGKRGGITVYDVLSYLAFEARPLTPSGA